MMIFNQIYDLHSAAVRWIRSMYPEDIAKFINLLIFNADKFNNKIYKDFLFFGVAHIMVISGFHLFLVKNILTKILKKLRCPDKSLTWIVLFVYWWAINFSITGFRPLMVIIFKNKKTFIEWSQIVIITFVLFPDAILNYSFLLSFFIPFLFLVIDRSRLSSFSKKTMKFIHAFLFSHLLLMPMTKKIYFLSFINHFIFYPIVCVLFFYFLCFFWARFLYPLHSILYEEFKKLLSFLSINKSYLSFDSFNQHHVSWIMCLIVSLYLISHKYKEIRQTDNNFNIDDNVW